MQDLILIGMMSTISRVVSVNPSSINVVLKMDSSHNESTVENMLNFRNIENLTNRFG